MNPPLPLAGGLLHSKKAGTYLGLGCLEYNADHTSCVAFQWLKNRGDLARPEDWQLLTPAPLSMKDVLAQSGTVAYNFKPDEHLFYSDDEPITFTHGALVVASLNPAGLLLTPVGAVLDLVTLPVQLPSRIIRIFHKRHKKGQVARGERTLTVAQGGEARVQEVPARLVELFEHFTYVTCADEPDLKECRP